MTRTASLRRQHDAALQLAQEARAIITAIGGHPTDATVFPLTMVLAKLTGTLRIHLAQEDRCLYPELMASGRGGVAATARQFFEEMGQLAPQIAAYSAKWLSSDAILADWDGFRLETAALFSALSYRIQCENEILYPLADAMTADQAAHAA
jgi:iron-sulfur cluster repair protein YtfE (RIC family)